MHDMKNKSLIIAIVNVISVSVVFAESELEVINQYGWFRFVFIPFEVCATFSVFFALIGLFVGIKELKKRHNKRLSYVGITINSVFLLWFAFVFINNYDAMLGR